METDPFDDGQEVYPFTAEIYAHDIDPIVIWNNDYKSFADDLYAAIVALPGRYRIYAHNGGRFDWMFLIHLLRGEIKFKGRSLMSAKIGEHEIRDSLHIIPVALSAYEKDEFDYTKLKRSKREKYKKDILAYQHADCVNTHEIVSDFIENYGNVVSIGQASMKKIKEKYKFDTLNEETDGFFRKYFFGGRVECLQGPGKWRGNFKLYDVNSMYPGVMAAFKHPISKTYKISKTITNNTAFVTLECDNYGALLARDGTTVTPNVPHGIFHTTIHEFQTAMKLGLIKNVKIIETVDFETMTDFSETMLPLYREKQELSDIRDAGDDSRSTARKILFTKFFLNNAYGKFAQDPRKFKDHYITDLGDQPEGIKSGDYVFAENGFPWKIKETVMHDYNPEMDYAIWERDSDGGRYNNVCTAASITGAARSVLLRAISEAIDPLYCDTDSIICRDLPAGNNSSNELGKWKLETEIKALYLGGKKLYAYQKPDNKWNCRAKGANQLTEKEIENIVDGISVINRSKAPVIKKNGSQQFINRTIKLTCPVDYRSRIFECQTDT